MNSIVGKISPPPPPNLFFKSGNYRAQLRFLKVCYGKYSDILSTIKHVTDFKYLTVSRHYIHGILSTNSKAI